MLAAEQYIKVADIIKSFNDDNLDGEAPSNIFSRDLPSNIYSKVTNTNIIYLVTPILIHMLGNYLSNALA